MSKYAECFVMLLFFFLLQSMGCWSMRVCRASQAWNPQVSVSAPTACWETGSETAKTRATVLLASYSCLVTSTAAWHSRAWISSCRVRPSASSSTWLEPPHSTASFSAKTSAPVARACRSGVWDSKEDNNCTTLTTVRNIDNWMICICSAMRCSELLCV